MMVLLFIALTLVCVWASAVAEDKRRYGQAAQLQYLAAFFLLLALVCYVFYVAAKVMQNFAP